MDTRKLIKETRWMRVYGLEEGGLLYESKFLVGEAKISAAELAQEWEGWASDNRLEFANAFAAHDKLTSEDVKILDFLMEQGDQRVWSAISITLSHHPDRERVIRFFMDRIRTAPGRRMNYYQAAAYLGDPRLVPALREVFLEYQSHAVGWNQGGPDDRHDCFEYLACCRGLWLLDGGSDYEQAIRRLLTHPDSWVRSRAEGVLREKGQLGKSDRLDG